MNPFDPACTTADLRATFLKHLNAGLDDAETLRLSATSPALLRIPDRTLRFLLAMALDRDIPFAELVEEGTLDELTETAQEEMGMPTEKQIVEQSGREERAAVRERERRARHCFFADCLLEP